MSTAESAWGASGESLVRTPDCTVAGGRVRAHQDPAAAAVAAAAVDAKHFTAHHHHLNHNHHHLHHHHLDHHNHHDLLGFTLAHSPTRGPAAIAVVPEAHPAPHLPDDAVIDPSLVSATVPTTFFPDLSVSPSPAPEDVHTRSHQHSSQSSVYSDFSSASSSPFLGPDRSFQDFLSDQQQPFSALGSPLSANTLHSRCLQQQQIPAYTTTPLSGEKRKRGTPKQKKKKHPFTTFKNGFEMTFTDKDDYNTFDVDDFESDVEQAGKRPAGGSITLDPKKRLEKQRAARATAVTAAATRGRRQLAASTAKTASPSSAFPTRKATRSGSGTPASSRRQPSRPSRQSERPKPNYKVDSSGDEDDDNEADEDEYSVESNSHSSDDHNEDDDNNDDEKKEAKEGSLPERVTSAGHSLRSRASLSQPGRLKEYITTDPFKKSKQNGDKAKGQHKKKYQRLGKGLSCEHCHQKRIRCDIQKPRCGNCVKYNCDCISRSGIHPADGPSGLSSKNASERVTTQREDIRKAIQEGATKKRWNFFRAYEHLFAPLLPEKNFIARLNELDRKEKEDKAAKASSEGEQPKKDKDNEGDIEMGEGGAAEEKQTLGEAIEQNNQAGIQGVQATEATGPQDDKPQAVPYKLLEEQPSGVKATMKPYQLAGLSFLVWLYNNGASGILGDEMGLGKTLQTLSLFSYLTEQHPSPPGHHRPFLVVCPLSVLSSWMAECNKWTPHLRALRFHGSAIEKERMKKVAEHGVANEDGKTFSPYDVVITTYEAFEKDVSWFRRAFVWRYVVLDEGHKIKNEMTNISQAVQGLSAEYRLVLTGTPLQNNLKELWALLHFIMPEVFTSNTQQKFANAFDLTNGKVDRKVMDDSRRLLELIMLRRMKDSKGVNLGLPPKREVVLSLPLTPMQRFWYKRLLTRLDMGLLEDLFKGAKSKEEQALEDERQALSKEEEQLEKVEEGLENGDEETKEDSWKEAKKIMEQSVKQKGTGWQKLMNLLMQLRKCCNHPYLLPGASPEPYFIGQHIMLASSKIIILDRLIDELCIKQGRKVLIFSGFTRMLDIVEEFLSYKGGDGEKFHYSRLDGGTCRARRNLEIRLFNSDPKYKIMLLSTRAGGLGINLASASDVVMLESDWNPQADLQAQARAHRIGQTREVTVYRLITQGTVEEQMMGRIRKKLYLSAKVTESMRDIHSTGATRGKGGRGRPKVHDEDDVLPNLTTGQLMSLVRRGAQAIARPEIDPGEMLKWDWNTMVDRTKDYEMTLEPSKEGKKAKKEEKEEEGEGSSGDKSGAVEIVGTEGGVAANGLPEDDLEQKWLSEMEKVETRLFEGREHKKREEEEQAKLILDITRDARREGKQRVVMINGHAVLKATVGCAEWEAVPTISGKGKTVFSEPKKEKKEVFEHQDYCQICLDGGLLSLCNGCPRAYHLPCLSPPHRQNASSHLGFYCPQHQCLHCDQKTTNAGGMLYRCRWCEAAFCEDCLEWDQTVLIGDGLVEMDLWGYREREGVYWIKCQGCVQIHKENRGNEALCEGMEKEWAAEWERRKKLEELQEGVEEGIRGTETPGSGTGTSLLSASTRGTTTAATSVEGGSDKEEVADVKCEVVDLETAQEEVGSSVSASTSTSGSRNSSQGPASMPRKRDRLSRNAVTAVLPIAGSGMPAKRGVEEAEDAEEEGEGMREGKRVKV
ncbi:SNF2 family N-terminal domain-containing protein [Kalaharituber pfeilii]|nr:SNF2 family N-terminal domain-containing protein [Kalaharituber pfeilii]